MDPSVLYSVSWTRNKWRKSGRQWKYSSSTLPSGEKAKHFGCETQSELNYNSNGDITKYFFHDILLHPKIPRRSTFIANVNSVQLGLRTINLDFQFQY